MTTSGLSKKELQDLLMQIFNGSYPGRMNACVNWKSNWRLFSDSYIEAAKVMIQEVLNSNRKHDLLIHPVLFCLRHHLELCFKYFICLMNKRFDVKPKFIREHDIEKLWGILKITFQQSQYFTETLDCEFIKKIDMLINYFHTYDSGSYVFRYPNFSDNGIDSPFRDKKLISYNGLARLVEEVESIRYGLGGYLEQLDNHINDYLGFVYENQEDLQEYIND